MTVDATHDPVEVAEFWALHATVGVKTVVQDVDVPADAQLTEVMVAAVAAHSLDAVEVGFVELESLLSLLPLDSSDGQLPILMPKMRLMHGNFGNWSSKGSGKGGKLKRSTGRPPPEGMITRPVCSLEEPETDVVTHSSLDTDEGKVIIDTPCGSVVKVVDAVMGSTVKGIMPSIKLVDCVVKEVGIASVPRGEDDAADVEAIGCVVDSEAYVMAEDVADDAAPDCC
jgi:hypothetical protein